MQTTTIGGQPVYWLCEGRGDEDEATLLGPQEHAAYAALRTAKRRGDWLLGRRVAKRLLHAALSARLGSAPPLREIVILPHPDGWPQVALPTLATAAPPLRLSISHSHDRAFCALTLADVPLGGDLELIEPRSPGFVADYFTAAERELMAAAPPDRQATLANAIWSGKEAALKAIRRGLAEDTRLVSCLPGTDGAAAGWRPLVYHWTAAGRALPSLTGCWREADGFVLTLAGQEAS